jgi:hypothetical protein
VANKKYDREFLISKVAMMRIKGKSTHFILEFLMGDTKDGGIGMSRKIAYDILSDAQKYIMSQVNKDTEIAIAEAVSRLEQIIENGDSKLKLDAQKELNKLLGLYAASKIDLTTGGDKLTSININIVKAEDGSND